MSNPAGSCSNDTMQSNAERTDNTLTEPLVAIVGGGVVGVILAHGLLHRGVRVAIYERASNFHEIGAGFAFTGVARKCMSLLSPAVIESMSRVGIPNKRPFDNYWDGYHSKHAAKTNGAGEHDTEGTLGDPDGTACDLLFRRSNHQLSFCGCLRAQFLDHLAAALPRGIAHFNKELVTYSDSPSIVTLHFTDGTTTTADGLIGCDGLRSRVRAQLLATDAPVASIPRYTHKRCYRAVIPLQDGERALGADKANNQCMHVGPGAHVLTYPVSDKMLNVVIFVSDEKDWPDSQRMTCPGRREDVLRALEGWSSAVRGLAALLPAEPLVWGIFDMLEHPAPWYAKNKVCLAGDAAHASAPHLGAGAGFGVEDALALVTTMEEALKVIRLAKDKEDIKSIAIATAFRTFSHLRYERTQWLVRSSHEAGEIYEWQYAASGSDPTKMKTELDERFRVIWDFDVDKMVHEARSSYRRIIDRVDSVQ